MSNDLLKVTQLSGRRDSQSRKSDVEPYISHGTRALSQGPQGTGPSSGVCIHYLQRSGQPCKVDTLTLNETSSGRTWLPWVSITTDV